MKKVTSFLEHLEYLEEQKWGCILGGAEVKPENRIKVRSLDKKLDKFYKWFVTAYENGLVPDRETGEETAEEACKLFKL